MRAVLGVSRSTAYRLAPKLGAIRVGTSLRIPVDGIRVAFGDAAADACQSPRR
jgi:hypothetical protein